MREGDKLDGYFNIGQNKDLEFWIEDPLGNKVHKPGKIVGTHKFYVNAQVTGVYNLVFHNSFLRLGRTVGLYWRILSAN